MDRTIADLILSSLFFIIPISVGRFFTKQIGISWIFGSLIWFIYLLVISSLLDLINTKTPYLPIFTITTLSLFFSSIALMIYKNRKSLIKTRSLNISKFFFLKTFPYSILVALSLVLYFYIWRDQTPFPLQLNWDIYEHITASNNILQYKLSFFPSQISDSFTFDGYTSFFQLLLTLPLSLISSNLIGVYFFLEYWHFLLTILVSYLLAKTVFKSTAFGILGGIISAFIFESSVVYSTFFLIPQSMAGVWTIIILIGLINKNIHVYNLELPFSKLIRSLKLNQLLIALLSSLFLIHFIIGFLGILIILTFIILEKKNINNTNLNKLIFLLLIALMTTAVLHIFGTWTITDREEAIYFNLSLYKKISLLFDWYSLFLPFFYSMGVLISVKSSNRLLKILTILSLISLVISIAPFSYFLKFFVIGRYLINLIILSSFVFLLSKVSKVLKYFSIIWIAFVFFVVFYTNQSNYKDQLYFLGYRSHISKSEIELSNWLNQNYSKETLIISDPATQYVLEAISGINSQGGAYMDIQTRQTLSSINNLNDKNLLKERLLTIEDRLPHIKKNHRKTLFIVGGRYFKWQDLPNDQKLSFYYNVWRPYPISYANNSYLNFLTNNFKTLYQNDQLLVLEIK